MDGPNTGPPNDDAEHEHRVLFLEDLFSPPIWRDDPRETRGEGIHQAECVAERRGR